jgi:hypothetical protein
MTEKERTIIRSRQLTVALSEMTTEEKAMRGETPPLQSGEGAGGGLGVAIGAVGKEGEGCEHAEPA